MQTQHPLMTGVVVQTHTHPRACATQTHTHSIYPGQQHRQTQIRDSDTDRARPGATVQSDTDPDSRQCRQIHTCPRAWATIQTEPDPGQGYRQTRGTDRQTDPGYRPTRPGPEPAPLHQAPACRETRLDPPGNNTHPALTRQTGRSRFIIDARTDGPIGDASR